MSTESYQRLLQARYNKLSRYQISEIVTKILDEVLAMPHPDRERAFVGWPQRISEETMRLAFLGELKAEAKQEIIL